MNVCTSMTSASGTELSTPDYFNLTHTSSPSFLLCSSENSTNLAAEKYEFHYRNSDVYFYVLLSTGTLQQTNENITIDCTKNDVVGVLFF